jgi:hypothetical protein
VMVSVTFGPETDTKVDWVPNREPG